MAIERNHVELFKNMDKNYRIMIKTPQLYNNEETVYSFMSDYKTLLYDIIYNKLNKMTDSNEKYIRFYCNYIKDNILPLCNKKLNAIKSAIDNAKDIDILERSEENYDRWSTLEDDYFAMVAYRNLKYYAYYIERSKRPENRIWDKTMSIFEPFFYNCEKMILNKDVDKIRASYMPSMGKTYAGNLVCTFWISYDIEMTILRITYSDDLAKKFTKQISNILQSDRHKKVFPKFNKPKKDVFAEDSAYCIKLKGSEENNFNAMTRYGQVTGKRGRLLMSDDLLKGQLEAGNFKIQDEIVGLYDSDWTSRADSEDQKEIHLGTMWSNHDLLNVLEKRDSEITEFHLDTNYKYTKISENGKIIYIGVPALDYETDESTCPLRYSTQFLRRKRDTIDPFIWNAEYQQRPQEPETLPFAYSRLKTYTSDTIPNSILTGNCQTRNAIDPNRRGIDYLVVLVLKRCKLGVDEEGYDMWSDWYFTDVICRKDIYKNLRDEIASKISKNKAERITVEINTSNELSLTLEEDLAKYNYYDYEIQEIYSTENKQTKIATAQYDIRDHIIFPAKGMFASNSEMGIAMKQLTEYNIQGKVDHDDVPDCFATFIKNNSNEDNGNTLEVVDRL